MVEKKVLVSQTVAASAYSINLLKIWLPAATFAGLFLYTHFVKIFAGFFFLVFLAFAFLQLNDPDPLVWVTVYLFSVYTCGSAFRNYYNPMLISIMCLGYLLGALFLFPGSPSAWLHHEEAARSLQMDLPFVEEARESMGLAICFLVNVVFLIKGYKGAKAEIPMYDKATEKPFE